MNIKKSKDILLFLFIAGLATLALFLLPNTKNLITSYIFAMIGIAAMGVSFSAMSGGGKSALIKVLPFFMQARTYLFLSLVVSIIVVALENFRIFTVSLVAHIIIQTTILLLFLIRIVLLSMGKARVNSLDVKAAVSRAAFAELIAQANTLKKKADAFPEENRAQVKKGLQAVYDALRYSNPVSAKDVAGLDMSVKSGMEKLSAAVLSLQAEDTLKCVESLLQRIQERNERNRATK